MNKNIKFLVMDVDGTLTDGKIYIGKEKELFKVFDVKDGYGIKDILPQYGIIPIIITARYSKILENRCKELNICYLYQGIKDKLRKLNEIIELKSIEDRKKYSYINFAYIGDDLPDLECMAIIKENDGLVACPADAIKKIKEISNYICSNNAGNGAVREFIEKIIEY